ncbi:hypothetical protein B484DRAFT_418272 [Ochromonadaceae sp. CCMP2298]|nr:hypothetical protein B484DRAFT_418272 [Ochromonadaceae sp. CCMP2298]
MPTIQPAAPGLSYLSQVLIVEVNNCIDCHVGTCLCAEASGPPPGGFHIVAASIVPRNPCGKHKVSRGIEPLIKEGWGFCTLGRLVVLSDPRAKTLFFQWCFTDSPQDPYTSTQLLQAINRDEEYAVPEIDKRFMLPPCGVPITYSGEPSTGQADIQEVVEFGLSGEPSTPAGMAAYRSQHERLKARANMAEPHKCMCASCSNCSRRWWGRLYEGGVGEKARVRVEVRVENYACAIPSFSKLTKRSFWR